jgi:uncharacterized repeat protein (TIGR01451 family)
MLRFVFRRRLFTAAVLAVAAACVFWVVAASADAPDVNNTTNYPSGTQTQLVSAVDNGNGTTTVTVKGGWSWPTHTTDCNTDRAGAGYAIDWSDPNDDGFLLASLNGTDIRVGSTGSNHLNPYDRAVHVTPNLTGATAVHDITDPTDWQSWRGGCGKYLAGTYTDSKGTHTGTFSQGTWGPISHVYSTPHGISDLSGLKICAVTYDVHGGTDAADNGGAGIPADEHYVLAAGTIGSGPGAVHHNNDNSVEGNDHTPAGNACASLPIGFIELKKEWSGAAGSTTLTIRGPNGYSKTATANGGPGDTGLQAVLAATYNVSETSVSGYSSSLSCVNAAKNNATVDSSGGNVAVGVGDQVVCTFTNTQQTGKISFEKIVVGGSAQPGDFTFHANGNAYKSGDSDTFPVGDYTVTEDGVSGYTLTGASGACSLSSGTITLHVTSDGGTCTITNTRDQGTIDFKKVVVGGSAQPSDFTFNVDGNAYKDGDSHAFDTGSYTLTEDQLAGYTLTDASGACSLDQGTVTLAVTSDGGTCTITNTRDQGTIEVKKVVQPDSDNGTFDFTIGSTLFDNGTDGYGNGDSTGAQSFDTGSYSISESGNGDTKLSDYTSAWSCDNESSGTGTTIPSVEIAKGDAVTCTFTNTRKATIVVEEKTVGGDTSFTFTGHPSGSLSNNGTSSEEVAAGGTYTTTQTQKSGWTLTSIVCTTDGAHAGTSATYTPGAGETVACVFTNTKASTPTPPSTPAPPQIDLAITKSGSPNPATVGNQITWTETVTNNGPDGATGVKVADQIPAGTTFVSVSATQGTCTGGAVVSCSLGDMAKGATVTITIVTTANAAGTITNTTTVVGNESETNTANNTASASVAVNGAFVPPKAKPPAAICSTVVAAPKLLYVGRGVTITLHIAQRGKAAKGVRIRITGPGLNVRTKPSNARGVIKVHVKPKKAGIVRFTPIKPQKACKAVRIGITGVFTPPVTG